MAMKTRFLILIAAALAVLGVGSRADAQTVVIDTVVPEAANTTVMDEDGDTPAYIRIRNMSGLFAVTVNLEGWSLTDDPAVPRKWVFPAGVSASIPPDQTITVFASGKDRVVPVPGATTFYHTNFTYPCNVPYCGIYDTDGALRDSFENLVDQCRCRGVRLVGPRSVVRWIVPSADVGGQWPEIGFNDRQWGRGLLCLGYDVGVSTNPYCTDLVLHHTNDEADVDLERGLVLDVSGSPNVHDGTLGGGVFTAPGQIAESLRFGGVSEDAVVVADHPELDPGASDFTVALWINAGSDVRSGIQGVMAKGGVFSSPGWAITRTAEGTRVEVNGSFVSEVVFERLAVGEWTHLAVVVEPGEGFYSVYRDGALVDRVDVADDVGSDRALVIGGSGGLLDISSFAGNLDDVAIWRRAMTAEEVALLHDVGAKGLSFKDLPGEDGPGPYAPLITTDVEAAMLGVGATLYARVPFALTSYPTLAEKLTLNMKYDDGFVAYLNGVKVAERNVPADGVSWDSAAASDRPDADALVTEAIDLTDFIPLLRAGANVLAIHGLNAAADAERFLVCPELCLEISRGTGGPGGEECEKTTNGRDFWVCFPENFEEEEDAPLELSLCIAGAPETFGIVEIPGVAAEGFPRFFSIPGSGSLTIVLPDAVELDGDDSLEFKGVHVAATADVAVYGQSRRDFTTDTFLALPTKCLGIEYLAMGYHNVHDDVPLLHGTQFGVVAPFDFTTLTITPREAVGTHPAGVPFQVILNRGETWQLRNESGKPADLTGTEILSDKPVAVFGSHRCANVASSTEFFCDFVVEELLPVNAWATNYYVAPLKTRQGDIVRILASRDNTPVTINGTNVATLDRGESFDYALAGGPGAQGVRISSDFRLLVAQYSKSADADGVVNSDPFMALVQPESSWMTRYDICSPVTSGFADNYITAIARTQTDLDQVRVDGIQAVSLPGADQGAVFGGLRFVRARVGAGHHVVTGRGAFALTIYGFDEFDSYGNPGSMRFDDTSAPILFCPPELTVGCNFSPDVGDCAAPTPDLIALSQFYDDCSPAAELTITQEPPAGIFLTVGDHDVRITARDAAGNSADCVVVVHVVENWEQENFGAAALDPSLEDTLWGPYADPDGDGWINLCEEDAGSDPLDPGSLPISDVHEFGSDAQGNGFLVVRVRRPTVTGTGFCRLEGSLDLEAWNGGADAFREIVAERRILPGGQFEELAFIALDTVGAPMGGRYFIRLTYDEGSSPP